MPAVTCPPPLGWWDRVWRYALVLTISGLSWFELAKWQWQHERWWFWSDLAIGVGALVLTHWRRRWPVAVTAVTNLATAVSSSAGGPATLALMSLATRRRWREIVPLAALSLVGSVVLEVINPVADDTMSFAVLFVVALIGITIGWGMYVGSRRELLATLRERAETAEAEQAAHLVQARTAERSRIAREMHDVLAHRISLVTMHAGALVYREDLDADQMRATARIIQDNSHQAMVELREVLGLLRDGPGDADPELPQPSAKDIPGLVEEARRSGMRVVSGREIDVLSVPDALGRTLYRVVQEALTNARKHAPDTLVTVHLDGGPDDGVSVEVRNLLPLGVRRTMPPESGLGLIGLTERAQLSGGHLSHHIRADSEFVLEAWLPWPA